MIEYKFIFMELSDGTFKVDMRAPPQSITTEKERIFAEHFSKHVTGILKRVAELTGGACNFGGDS